jgi:hypothetical protein
MTAPESECCRSGSCEVCSPWSHSDLLRDAAPKPAPEYPCDECGTDGPHTVVEVQDDGKTLECGACHVEFFVPSDPVRPS